MTPKRGDIRLVNFNPVRSSEQAGIRPALIIQNDVGNRVCPTTIVATITSAIRDYPICVSIRPNPRKPVIYIVYGRSSALSVTLKAVT
jgi:mRNA interferase MazF